MEKHKKESEFDNETFFEEYAKMARSVDGLEAAGEWHQLRPLFPALEGKTVLDLGNGDAVKRLCRSTNFGFIQCVRPCSHAQNCIFHIFRVTHIAELGAVIVQKALRAFAPCRNHRHAGRECFHGRNAERLNIRSHQKGVGLA